MAVEVAEETAVAVVAMLVAEKTVVGVEAKEARRVVAGVEAVVVVREAYADACRC
jgi:hypothetical protein